MRDARPDSGIVDLVAGYITLSGIMHERMIQVLEITCSMRLGCCSLLAPRGHNLRCRASAARLDTSLSSYHVPLRGLQQLAACHAVCRFLLQSIPLTYHLPS